MHPLFNKLDSFVFQEHTGILKAANSYDVLHPETGEKLMVCTEEQLSTITKILRFSPFKSMTPFFVVVRDTTGAEILSLRRGVSVLFSRVEVFDESHRLIGMFQGRFSFPRKKIDVLDNSGVVSCVLRSNWIAWDFRLVRMSISGSEEELATISKKWAGLAREWFTTAFRYFLNLNPVLGAHNPLRLMVFAAVICIDMVFKEKKKG